MGVFLLTRLPPWVEVGAFLLAFLAGTVNAVGLRGFSHQSVSHMTGISSLLGLALAALALSNALHLLFTPLPLRSAAPPYSPHRFDPHPGDNIGLIVEDLRTVDLDKRPGVAETLDWAAALLELHIDHLTPDIAAATLGCIAKTRRDLELVRRDLPELLARAQGAQ